MSQHCETPEPYYLLTTEGYGACIVPVEGFWDIFVRHTNAHSHSPGTVRQREDYVWHSMSGGLDTYLQGWALDHARSGLHANGEWEEPKLVKGTFYLKDN
jgi:hypothetical protein